MSHKLKKDHAIAGLVLGILEMLFGLIITILSFVLVGKTSLGASRSPYWAGIIFIVPGILGAVSGFTRNRGAMIAFMVLNIIALVIECIGFIVLVLVISTIALYATANSTTCDQNYPYNCVKVVDASVESIAYAIIVFLILSILVALASSILGCISVCCSSKSKPTTVIIQQPGMVMQQPGMVMQQPAYPPTYDYTVEK
ncbi:uncharacterized protein LOC136084834 [Hydra vulgaris]|uniref:Uncharacterized protein LOC136084834 n=1 Tax=Hydra vulgaris TaxID=6087 RepID=A0ABM4CJQ4_HYDVU